MKKIYKLLMLLCAIAIAAVGCKDDEGKKAKTPTGKTETGSAVYVLDSEQTAKLQSVDDENGTVVFSGLTDDNRFETGDIICSAPTANAPRGFLYRVKNTTTKDGQTIVETQEASLEEAIQNVEFSETINLDEHIEGIYDEDGNRVEYTVSNAPTSQASRAKAVKEINLKIGKTFKNADSTASISLDGSLRLSNELEFEMNIENWKLKYYKLANTTKVEAKIAVSGEISVKKEWEKRLYTIKLTPVVVPVLGVPVIFTPEIPIDIKCEANGKISGDFTLMDIKYSVATGTMYNGSKVESIFEKEISKSNSLEDRASLSLSGELTAGIETGVGISLYNYRGVSVEATATCYGKAETTLDIAQLVGSLTEGRYGVNPELKVSLGIEAGVKSKLKIFKLNLLDFEASRKLIEWELLRGSVFPQFADISLSDKTENSARAFTAAQTPAVFGLVFPVSQHGICISENPLPTIETAQRYDLGTFPTLWTTANVPTVSANLTNLQKDKTYYACVYFTNFFGTFYGKVQSFKLEGEDPEDPDDPSPNGDYVIINGIKWATRNVDMPGTFAARPEDAGKFYQWNRKTAWNTIDETVSGWSDTYAAGTTWEKANDPSPAGWRVPTSAEQRTLGDTEKVTREWTTQNGVSGYKFTDKTTNNSLFLPAAGNRGGSVGTLFSAGSYGYYWNSTQAGSNSAYSLVFGSGYADWDLNNRINGFSVRAVAE
jgi:uncharacterized protein (TIGR02145 family)